MMAWCLARIPEDKREEWDYEMNAPLPGESPKVPSRADTEADGEAFMNFMKQQKGA